MVIGALGSRTKGESMITSESLGNALATARDRLLAQREPAGYWAGWLSSSALSTATSISALALAGDPRDAGIVTNGVLWLADTQNSDGGWGDTPDSPSNLSTSLLGLSALRIAGGLAGSTGPNSIARGQDYQWAITRAEGYITSVAGIGPERCVTAIIHKYGKDRTFAVPILMNCALAGIVPWSAVPELPYEFAALPSSFYNSLGLTVVSYALPALIAVGMSIEHHNPSHSPLKRSARRSACSRVRRTLATLQPDHGGFLEAPPLTGFVAMGLISVFGNDDPVAARCLDFLRGAARHDGSWPIDINLSIWLTTQAFGALTSDGGMPDDAEVTITRWLIARQYHHVHPFTGAQPGGWAWTHLPGGVPDADDTAGAVLALAGRAPAEVVDAGTRWLLGVQNRDGGWPTFCRGWGHLPFDRSCPEVTAHAMRALTKAAHITHNAHTGAAVERGMRYLAASQRPDGSWLPLWFGNQLAPDESNPVFGTARVVRALADLNEADAKVYVHGVEYLLSQQNSDGGWGACAGQASSVEESALASAALCDARVLAACPQETKQQLAKGISYLIGRVEDTSWAESTPIGLYFASLWYSEKLYSLIWTVEALGRAASVLDQLGIS